MTTSPAELSSVTTALEDLTRRITEMADGYATGRREDLATELYAVERQLRNATRRLAKVVASETGDGPARRR